MRFEWDDRKNRANIERHGLSFASAKAAFQGPMAVGLDDREDYGEDRWIGLGTLGHRIVVVVYTEPDHDTIRILSLRKALSHERRDYEEFIRNRLGTSGRADR